MIDMTMRNQNRIQMVDLRPQSLLPKIDRGINEDLLIAMLDQDRNSQAFVTRVLRKTRFAIAPDRGNAGRCACAEEGEFHL